MFIKQSIKEENISEYRPKANVLIQELINFASEFKDDEEDPSALEKLKSALGASEIEDKEIKSLETELERVIKMFYLHMRVKG
jgi:hypothetical protein